MDFAHTDPMPLEPHTPADFADLFIMLAEELAATLAADTHEVIRPLALLGVRHAAGHAGLRCLLHGEPGTGKTSVARILAELTGFPFLRIPLGETAQTAWRGTDLPAYVNAAYRDIGPRPNATQVMSRAVVLLDDLQVLRLKPFASHGDSARDQREGLQSSLLSVLSGETLSISEGDWTWDSSRCLVFSAGHLAGLNGDVDAVSLTKWGVSRPLAERMTVGSNIRLTELPAASLADVAIREARSTVLPAFEAFGYRLTITAEAVRHSVWEVRQRDQDAGPRQVIASIRRAADRLLMRLIEVGAPPGTAATLSPDDLAG